MKDRAPEWLELRLDTLDVDLPTHIRPVDHGDEQLSPDPRLDRADLVETRIERDPAGTAEPPVHDSRRRSRQHLHFFEYRAFIHASVPRVRCGACGKITPVEVPRARPAHYRARGEPARVTAACMHMSKAYIARVGKYLPEAAITFDGFHVIQLANEAVDEVRRAEVRTEPVLKHTRWVWLKDGWHWTKRQLNDFHNLSRTRLKIAGARFSRERTESWP